MKNSMEETLLERVQPSFQSYANVSNDVAYSSVISSLNITSATSFSISYSKPADGMPVYLRIWKGLIADISQTPVFTQTLKNYTDTINVSTPALNLLKDSYTVAIGSDDVKVEGATQSILNGQNIQAGSSTLIVISKNLTSINTVFNMPANILASQTFTYVILYQGSNLGQGTCLATQTTTPNQSSGLVQVTFQAGTLIEGQTYNVILNPGPSTRYITAGYVFTYALQ